MASEKDIPKKPKKDDGESKLHEKKPPEKVPIPKPSFAWEGPPALVVVGGQGLTLGSRLNLKMGTTVLGRSPEAGIPILDGSLSRLHLELTLSENGECTANDLHSRHGSFVNEVPLTEPRVLEDGDHLRCGNVVLKFRFAKGAPMPVESKTDKRPVSPRPTAQREETTARGGAKAKDKPAEEATIPKPRK